MRGYLFSSAPSPPLKCHLVECPSSFFSLSLFLRRSFVLTLPDHTPTYVRTESIISLTRQSVSAALSALSELATRDRPREDSS